MTDVPLRVLLLEDVPDDATLIEYELRRAFGQPVIERVDEREPFLEALHRFAPHIILSDHRMAGFSGTDALQLVRERAPDTPFIFVTGSLDEETAVESIKAGAWDYVLKDRLVRLIPAVQGALELKRTREALERSEAQLRHAQKMDALGRLAGGVAHDYNNLATAILGYCELIESTLDPDDERRIDLNEIRRAATRAAELTGQLLAFSRKQIVAMRSLSLHEVLTSSMRLLDRLIGENIDLETRLEAKPDWIRSDPGQVEQIILNLAVNARDAMPRGGRIRITTSNVELDTEYCANNADAQPGPHVRLTVEDNGTGMDAATAARIFEPFFTTKPRGRGTGLGLATVYGIVRQSGGHIAVVSAPGAGATFHLLFPLADPPETEPPAKPERPRELGGNETILLVEDNEAVRRLATRLLQQQGYQVLPASSGAEALGLVERGGTTIHLLLTDLVMPDMTGIELATSLHARYPKIRILCMSGYSDDELLRQGTLPEGVRFLQKPFTAESFSQAIREVLEARN